MKIKKFILTLLIALLGLVLVACSSEEQEQFNFSSNKEVYGFEAMSAGFILNNFSTTESTPVLNSTVGTLTKLDAKEVSEEEIAKINEYLGIVEQMLGDENEPLAVETLESDLEEYSNKMIIKTKDLSLKEIEYILYYNVVSEEIDPEETDPEEIDPEETDHEDGEIESDLEGILIVGSEVFEVVGELEVEDDEIEISFVARIDENNWVRIEQEIESDEVEFKYVVCSDGVKTITRMSLEKNNNKTQLKLMFGEIKNKEMYIFSIDTENDRKVIKIKAFTKDEKLVVKVYVSVDPETNEVIYDYIIGGNQHKISHKNKHSYKDSHKGQHGAHEKFEPREGGKKHHNKGEECTPVEGERPDQPNYGENETQRNNEYCKNKNLI